MRSKPEIEQEIALVLDTAPRITLDTLDELIAKLQSLNSELKFTVRREKRRLYGSPSKSFDLRS